MRGELTLALFVLAATGVLTGLAPATNAAGGGPFAETRTVGELAITLSVTPNQAGANRFDVALAGPGGQPVSADHVTITLASQEMNMGQRELQTQPVGNGHYEASGNFVSMGGRWGAEVSVQRAAAPEVRPAFQFVAGQAPDSSRVAFSPARIVLNALNLRAAAGAIAILLALLIFLQLLGLRRARARRMGVLVGGALLLVGLFVTGMTLAAAYRASMPNPVPATPASLVLGQQTYVANCASCHGLSGRGDGPADYLLRPRPADFRIHMAAGHTDAQLFDWISHGVSGTAMPAFQNKLSKEQIWNVINYIRTFAQPANASR